MEPLITIARNTWIGQTLIDVPGGSDGHWEIVSTQGHAGTGPGSLLPQNAVQMALRDHHTGAELTITIDLDTPLRIERWEDRRILPRPTFQSGDIVSVATRYERYTAEFLSEHRNPDGKPNGIARVRVTDVGDLWDKRVGRMLDVGIRALTRVDPS